MKTPINTRMVSCHNLMPDVERHDIFRPVAPFRIIAPEGLTPVASADRNHLIVTSSNALELLNLSSGHTTKLIDLPASAACGVADGAIVASTPDGPALLEPVSDGSYTAASTALDHWPEVSVTAQPMASINMLVDSVRLSREYAVAESFEGNDRIRMLKAVNYGYVRLCAAARTQGVFFQPVLVRVVVRHRNGAVLHRGPVRLIMPPGGLPFDSPLQININEGAATSNYSVAVPTYRLRVVAGAAERQVTAERGARLELEIAPAFHSWFGDTAADSAQVTVSRFGQSSRPGCLVQLTGADTALTAHDADHSRNLVDAVLAGFNSVCRTVHVCDSPFEHGCDSTVAAIGESNLTDDVRRLRECIAASATGRSKNTSAATLGPSALTVSRLNPPHTFTARQMAATPSAVAYADIDALLYPGYSPLDYAARTDESSGAWSARTKVTYRDGAVSYRLSSGTSHRPLELDTFIDYPDPSALSLDITVVDHVASQATRWIVSLTPDSSGMRACALADNLAQRSPQVLPTVPQFAETTQRRPPLRMSATMAVASSRNPLGITAAADLGDKIVAVVGAAPSSGAWDYGRTRFNVFTGRRAMLANVDRNITSVATGVLACQGAVHAGAVAVSDTSATYFLGKHGYLYAISGSKTTMLAKMSDEVDRLGFDPEQRCLVAFSSTGNGVIHYVEPDTGACRMTVDSCAPADSPFVASGMLLLPTQSGLVDMTARAARVQHDGTDVSTVSDSGIRVRFVCEAPSKVVSSPMLVRAVKWNIDSDSFEGTLSVERGSLAGRASPITSFALSGPIEAPLQMAVVTRPATAVTLRIEGRASPATAIAAPALFT